MNGNIRLRYLYCRRDIQFFQQLFRGLEKFIEELEIGSKEQGRQGRQGEQGNEELITHALCPMPYAPILFPHP
ncbi:hypothetical protein VB740_36035 [Nostoc sp. UHCC 0251]|nr:hypothetical protein [Nostoc sp. UHCC 0251]